FVQRQNGHVSAEEVKGPCSYQAGRRRSSASTGFSNASCNQGGAHMRVRKIKKQVWRWSVLGTAGILLVGLAFAWGHSPAEGAARDQGATKTLAQPESRTATVEQTAQGQRPALAAVDSFDGLGEGFYGPQGGIELRDSTDNSLAVGAD